VRLKLVSLPTLTRSCPRRFAFYVAWPAAPFARLTHFRRIVVQRQPWLISFSLGLINGLCYFEVPSNSDHLVK
jgi:hypothetical protein